jgi:hypothetical protein
MAVGFMAQNKGEGKDDPRAVLLYIDVICAGVRRIVST